jgi:hypothetical protein
LTGVGVSGIVSTANATAITIDSSENVGVGITPVAKLDIGNSAAGQIGLQVYTARNDPLTEGLAYINSHETLAPFTALKVRQAGNGAVLLLEGKAAYGEVLRITSDGRGLSQFTAKAWVNFNGTGTVAIRGSHNVSSITDRGTGNYTVNFSNNMANANYSTVGSTNDNNAGGLFYYTNQTGNVTGQPQSTSSILIASNGGNSGAIDADTVSVQVFGD